MRRASKAAGEGKRRSSADFRVLPGALVIAAVFIIVMLVGYLIMALFNVVPVPPFLRSLLSEQSGGDSEPTAFEMMTGGTKYDLSNAEKLTLGEELPSKVLVGAVSSDCYLQQSVVEYTYGSSKRTFEVMLAVYGSKYRAEIREGEQLTLVICDGSRISVTENGVTMASAITDSDISPERDAMIPSVKDIVAMLGDSVGSVRKTDDPNVIYYISESGGITRTFTILYDGAIVTQAEYSSADGVFYSLNTVSLFTDCEFDGSAFVPKSEGSEE